MPIGRVLPRERPPTHPGEMLIEEFIKPFGISQSALAQRLGISFRRLNAIVRGRRPVTPDTALRLARVTGMPADFWLGLQSDWDLWHALRDKNATELAGLEPLRPSASGGERDVNESSQSVREERESALRLAQLGGTEPSIVPVPRRRPLAGPVPHNTAGPRQPDEDRSR